MRWNEHESVRGIVLPDFVGEVASTTLRQGCGYGIAKHSRAQAAVI